MKVLEIKVTINEEGVINIQRQARGDMSAAEVLGVLEMIKHSELEEMRDEFHEIDNLDEES